MQKRCNSIADALELYLICIEPSKSDSRFSTFESIFHKTLSNGELAQKKDILPISQQRSYIFSLHRLTEVS